MNTPPLPDLNVIRQRMACCRQELAALRKLLRLALAAREADEARRQRDALPPLPASLAEGGSHVA
jgi:hypothetical protein